MTLLAKTLLVASISGSLLAACRTAEVSDSEVDSLYDSSGMKIHESEANTDRPAWRPLTKADALTGVGVPGTSFVFFSADVCTLFLIDTGVPGGPGYVVTNAHCNFFEHLGLDPLGAEEVRTNLQTTYFAQFNHYVDVPEDQRLSVALKKLAYITENGLDLAIFKTQRTLAQTQADGVQPSRRGWKHSRRPRHELCAIRRHDSRLLLGDWSFRCFPAWLSTPTPVDDMD